MSLAYAPTSEIAYVQGYDAFEEGEYLSDCPYSDWCDDAYQWRQGYFAALANISNLSGYDGD